MKKISIMILFLVVALASCKKTPEVNTEYVDVERDLITVGMTTATVQCDYQYIATLKKAYFYYGEGENETDMNTAEMRVVQNTLYVDLAGLRANTTYSYYYEFQNGFNSMRTVAKTFKTEGSGATITLPIVVTAAVTEITANSAKSGGEVTNDGGAEVTERGICWGINENPTLNDNHVAAGMGTGVFTAAMTGLEVGVTYHVRAYAVNEKGTAYGLDREFVTLSNGGGEQEYVDLGLPSGTLWATCNVGANTPEDYGDYFAWGETQPKDIYDWSNYQHCNGSDITLTKYCPDSYYGYNGFSDNLSTLLPDDDAATVNWGNDWRMPTVEEWQELFQNTTRTWIGCGVLFTASNGNSIFLPAAGLIRNDFLDDDCQYGCYWSSSLRMELPNQAWDVYFDFYPGNCGVGNILYRYAGLSIRPVRQNTTPIPPGNVPEGAINGLFTINEEGDQIYFSQGNLQYQASSNTWRFAEHQWDYVGNGELGTVYEGNVKCNNSLISSTYNGWIDLFGWGTSGYNHGAVCYQPWSISEENSDYYAYGFYYYSLFEMSGQADWGYNSIINGGNTDGLWKTLTKDEIVYIINTRNTLSGIRFVKALVNDVWGVVLLPDNWDASVYSFNSPNDSGASYNSNVIDCTTWINVFESNGAVFMPITLNRIGQSISNGNYGVNEGYYWLATHTQGGSAYNMYFSVIGLIPDDDCGDMDRHVGRAVRLVQNVNP